MTQGLAASVGRVAIAAALLGMAACSGCLSERGPQMYKLTGKVTYDGRPIPVGDIRFEPLQGTVNRQTIKVAQVKDGVYTTEVTGGPHRVAVRDLSGGFDNSTMQSMFLTEYYTQADLPPLESVDDVHTYDLDIPPTHK